MTDMAAARYIRLDDRSIALVRGDDRVAFLHGLVCNDVRRVTADRAIHAALLTPQGKYLHDFFIAAAGEALLLDGERDRITDLVRRLAVYRLRSSVTVEDCSGAYAVAAVIGDDAARAVGIADGTPGRATAFAGGIAFVDPRLAQAGVRLMLPCDGGRRDETEASLRATGLRPSERGDYDRLRIGLGLPDGSRDITVEKALLLEYGFDELGSIDWQKGCYVGQELTARTKYRGLVRKRLVPVSVDGPLPPAGTPVIAGEGEVGEIRSGVDGLALALLRSDMLGGEPRALSAGAARVTPCRPGWMTV
jgi:hypothetical protein